MGQGDAIALYVVVVAAGLVGLSIMLRLISARMVVVLIALMAALAGGYVSVGQLAHIL